MCNFRGSLGGCSRIWGNLGCVRARWNFLASFGIGGNLERSFCMGGNLSFMALVELRGAFGRYGNLKGSFRRVKTSVCDVVGNFGVLYRVCGNLARLHIRNFRCAFAVCVKLRGFCAFGGTSGAFGGRIGLLGGGFMSFGGRLVVVGGHLLFRFSGNLVAFVVLSKLRFLHLFTYSAR